MDPIKEFFSSADLMPMLSDWVIKIISKHDTGRRHSANIRGGYGVTCVTLTPCNLL